MNKTQIVNSITTWAGYGCTYLMTQGIIGQKGSHIIMGAVGMVLSWVITHFHIGATTVGPATKPKIRNLALIIVLIGVIVGMMFSGMGCAYMSAKTRRSIVPQFTYGAGTNMICYVAGYTTNESTKTRMFTLLDASAQLTRANVHSSPDYSTNGNVRGSGTYIGALNENSSSTNLVTALQSLLNIAASLAATAAK